MSAPTTSSDKKPQAKPNVKLTINGKAIEVPAGTSVIDASEKAGVFVPRYCYHQDLSIAGVCRMCVVEIEKNPRLQISCNTACTEGMVVSTNSPKVKEAVKSALELHLINHPLDCPICDKAGECKLQDYYQDFGQYKSRMDWDNKTHKPKVQDIGTIVLDDERCILCTRCVRFTHEVTHTHELGIFNRGDRSVLTTYDKGPLRNEYTGNLADICPVGALTAKDFRFRQRVWFLEKVQTTCTMCARGCSTVASMNPSTKKLFRVEPRRNPDVNKSWMCDTGRWGYNYVDSPKRIQTPFFKKGERTWENAFKFMREELEKHAAEILVAISTQLTNEEIADLVTALTAQGVKQFTWMVDEAVVDDKKPYDGILKHKDRTGNAAGFEHTMKSLNVPWKRQKDVVKGKYHAVWIFGVEAEEVPWVDDFVKAVSAPVLLHATSAIAACEKAEWVLPNVSAWEKAGTVVNALGRMQKLKKTIAPQFAARDGHGVALGIERGNDRELVAAGRAESYFGKVTGGRLTQWKAVDALGVQV